MAVSSSILFNIVTAVLMRQRRVANSTSCVSTASHDADAASEFYRPPPSHVFLQPGSCPEDTQRERASRFSSECLRFFLNVWQPWRANAAALNSSHGCATFETDLSGVGNWLTDVLDTVILAAERSVPLRVEHYGTAAFFSALGIRLDNSSSCPNGRAVRPRGPRSWSFDPVAGTNRPTGHASRSGWSPTSAPMLGCAFRLFSCPTPRLEQYIQEHRAALPPAHVAVHARFGHQSTGQEGVFIRVLNAAYTRQAATNESFFADATNRALPLHSRLAPFDRLLAPVLPSLCRAVCETRRGEERLLPNPFLCCGGARHLEQLGVAVARELAGSSGRAYLTTDLVSFQEFVSQNLQDVFLQQRGSVVHSGGHQSSRLQSMRSVDEFDSGAHKTAADFMMLTHAQTLITLSPSTFSGVAAGLSRNGTLVHSSALRTCGLRRARPCADMRRK